MLVLTLPLATGRVSANDRSSCIVMLPVEIGGLPGVVTEAVWLAPLNGEMNHKHRCGVSDNMASRRPSMLVFDGLAAHSQIGLRYGAPNLKFCSRRGLSAVPVNGAIFVSRLSASLAPGIVPSPISTHDKT